MWNSGKIVNIMRLSMSIIIRTIIVSGSDNNFIIRYKISMLIIIRIAKVSGNDDNFLIKYTTFYAAYHKNHHSKWERRQFYNKIQVYYIILNLKYKYYVDSSL